MTIKIYTKRAQGIINKEAYNLEIGDMLKVTELTFPGGRKVVHLEVVKKKFKPLGTGDES